LRHPHDDFVSFVAFSPDGKLLASAGGLSSNEGPGNRPRKVYLWDTVTGREIRHLDVDAVSILCVAFSPKGNLVACCGKALTVWETLTGKRTYVFQRTCSYASFSPDGRYLAVVGGKPGVSLFELATQKWHDFQNDKVRRTVVVFSPDGGSIVAGSEEGSISVWDFPKGKSREFKGHRNAICFVAFSQDGRLFASASQDATIRVWNVTRGKEIAEFDGLEEVNYSFAFSPDGKKIAVGTKGAKINIWDVTTRKRLKQLSGHAGTVLSVAISADSKSLASGSMDKTIRIWDVSTGRGVVQSSLSHQMPIDYLAFFPDGKRIISRSEDGISFVWKTTRNRAPKKYDAITSIVGSPEGEILISTRENTKFRLWDPVNGNEYLLRAKAEAAALAFSAKRRFLVSAESDDVIRFWDFTSGKPAQNPINAKATSLALSSDASVLAIADGSRNISLWTTDTGFRLTRLITEKYKVNFIAISPDDRFIAATGPAGAIYLWGLSTWKPVRVFTAEEFGGSCLAFSKNGRIMATSGISGAIHLWEVATGKEVLRLKGDGEIRAICFSPNGRLLATAGGGDFAVIIWDATGQAQDRNVGEPSRKDLETWWTALAGDNARFAYSAVWQLGNQREATTSFLHQKLMAAKPVDKEHVQKLINGLASDKFTVRNAAALELEKMREQVESALKKAAKDASSLEYRRRIDLLLRRIEGSPERQRIARCIHVLEIISTQQAMALLEILAKGCPEAWITQEAQSTLKRLKR
jgi:WD40 repeat protein